MTIIWLIMYTIIVFRFRSLIPRIQVCYRIMFLVIVLIVHQTDKDGSKAGFRKNPDVNWNLQRIGNNWWMGRTEFTPWSLEITPKGSYRMKYRDVAGSRCEDDYLQQELDILEKYIKPTDICLQTIHRATTGVLLKYCKEVYTVVWDGRVYEY